MHYVKFMRHLMKQMKERVEQTAKYLADLRREALGVDYVRAAKILQMIDAAGFSTKDTYVSGYNRGEGRYLTTLHVSFTVKDGFKDPKLQAVLAYLSEMVGPANSSDYAAEWAASRTFNFSGEWFRVVVECVVPEDGATCRKVAVGEKTQTVTEYKIVCD